MTDFPTFWQQYPHKRGKFDAMKAWDAMIKSGRATAEEIIAGVEPYKANKEDWRAWMLPGKFIRQGFFMDEYEAPPQRLTREEQEEVLRQAGERVRARLQVVK